MATCTEKFGDKVEGLIGGQFTKVGEFIGIKPKRTIAYAFLLTALCGLGFLRWTTENRAVKLWVPQDTTAEIETDRYQEYFGGMTRFNQLIVQASTENENILTKDRLVDAMKMHQQIITDEATVDDVQHSYSTLCVNGAPGECFTASTPTVLSAWNYTLDILTNDNDVIATINDKYKNKEDLESLMGNAAFDENGNVVSAEAFILNYFTYDLSVEAGSAENGSEKDPINEGWEKDVFLATAESVPTKFASLSVDYISGRSFSDEFGGAISGDIVLVQVSYAVVFIFLGANFGNFKPGPGSRWTMSLSALVLVGMSIAASFGVSSAFGLFFGPVHSLLPFILLGIGVDDAFVIVNAFNRERKGPRSSESDEDLATRAGRAMKRAGASITVTSLTDLVAFGISASSRLPALASFCGYAAVAIVFLWLFASTFFASTLVLDERRQRDNRHECLCCVTRSKPLEEDESDKFEEDRVSRYFRNYHAPAILSKVGKAIILLSFSGLLAFGIWGATNLSVENTQRSFIPSGSYLTDYINTIDQYYPDSGIEVFFVFEGSSDIYAKREELVALDSTLSGKSTEPPFLAEPSIDTYRNPVAGLKSSLNGAWPTSEDQFVVAFKAFTASESGRKYGADVKFSDDGTKVDAIRVQTAYVALTREKANGDIIDDSDRQIEAMDATRALVEEWGDGVPSAFTYSEQFISIEGFKIIRTELFQNVGLSLLAVAVIVLITVASPVTAALITLSVAACITEILGFMHALGIAIDSVSVINIVLAVGLSIDYSAHVGHCFMLKGGDNKDRRALEALADIGAAVLSGATSTFLAVVVLLFSKSYVFAILSQQFALTVGLGVLHGLVLLPVLLSLVGPKPFSSAESPVGTSQVDKVVADNDLELEE